MFENRQSSIAAMDEETGVLKATRFQVSPCKGPEDPQLVLKTSEMSATLCRFFESLSDEQWRELNKGVYSKDVKKKLANMCAGILRQIILRSHCIELFTVGDIKSSFERCFTQALRSIIGADTAMKISPIFSQGIAKKVFRKAAALSVPFDSDPCRMSVPDFSKIYEVRRQGKTVRGAISTMKSFLTCQVTYIKKRFREHSKRASKAKKPMSLWKKCVLQMHRKKAESLHSTGFDACDSLVCGNSSTTQTEEQPHPSRSPTHPSDDSHGDSLRAAADPKDEVFEGTDAFKDLEEKDKAETHRQLVEMPELREKTQTEQPQLPKRKSPNSDLKKETTTTVCDTKKVMSLLERYLRPMHSNRVQPAPEAGMNSRDSSACDDLSTVEQPSYLPTDSFPNTPNEDLISNHETATPTAQSCTALKEDDRYTALELEDYVEDNTQEDNSDVDSPFTITEPIPTDQQIFEATYDSQKKTRTFPERQPDDSDDNVFSASEDTDITETQAKRKKGFFSFLCSLFKRNKKTSKSREEEKTTKAWTQRLPICCCSSVTVIN